MRIKYVRKPYMSIEKGEGFIGLRVLIVRGQEADIELSYMLVSAEICRIIIGQLYKPPV